MRRCVFPRCPRIDDRDTRLATLVEIPSVTGQEQAITIQAKSGLTDDEIKTMQKEAEEHADEDKKKKETVDALQVLMAETVISGTGRKAFRPLRRKKLFKKIAMGAKTGTINDKLDQYKYDWITAYALPDDGSLFRRRVDE